MSINKGRYFVLVSVSILTTSFTLQVHKYKRGDRVITNSKDIFVIDKISPRTHGKIVFYCGTRIKDDEYRCNLIEDQLHPDTIKEPLEIRR